MKNIGINNIRLRKHPFLRITIFKNDSYTDDSRQRYRLTMDTTLNDVNLIHLIALNL